MTLALQGKRDTNDVVHEVIMWGLNAKTFVSKSDRLDLALQRVKYNRFI